MEYHLTLSISGIDDDCFHLGEEPFVSFTLIHFDSQPGQPLHHLRSLADKKQKHKQETSTKLFCCMKLRRITSLSFFPFFFFLLKWIKTVYKTDSGLHNNINICSASWGLWRVAYLDGSDILGTLKVGGGLLSQNSGQRWSGGASMCASRRKLKKKNTAVNAEEKISLFFFAMSSRPDVGTC